MVSSHACTNSVNVLHIINAAAIIIITIKVVLTQYAHWEYCKFTSVMMHSMATVTMLGFIVMYTNKN